MSVKSTKILNRKEAEEKYLLLRKEYLEKILKQEVANIVDYDLEQLLMMMDDGLNNGESFRNYLINDDKW